jgi:hypothetical protein
MVIVHRIVHVILYVWTHRYIVVIWTMAMFSLALLIIGLTNKQMTIEIASENRMFITGFNGRFVTFEVGKAEGPLLFARGIYCNYEGEPSDEPVFALGFSDSIWRSLGISHYYVANADATFYGLYVHSIALSFGVMITVFLLWLFSRRLRPKQGFPVLPTHEPRR